MTTVQKMFPAESIDGDRTPSDSSVTEKLIVPPVYSEMSGIQHPAVSTSDSVFFAVNPSLAMFKGFGQWCISHGLASSLQISVLSSYSPVRIWKINPYSYCPGGDNGGKMCHEQHAEHVDVPGAYLPNATSVFDAQDCTRDIALAVTSMEYLNEENIAVTVLHASFEEFDLSTGRLAANATRAMYKIMYLNPSRMSIQDAPFVEQTLYSLTVQGQLCPAMRRFPPLGSLAMEIVAAFANIVRSGTSLVIAIPGLIDMWTSDRQCALSSHGHNLARSCGQDIFLLEEYWDSMLSINTIFWSFWSYLGEALRSLELSDLGSIVDGVAFYGQSSSRGNPVWSLGSRYTKILQSATLPFGGISQQISSVIFPTMPTYFKPMVDGNPILMAKFSWQLVGRSMSLIIPEVVNRSDKTNQRILMYFLDTLYQKRTDYKDGVHNSIIQGCAGLSLMLGYDKPWGTMMRKICESVPHATLGIYDILLAITVEVPVVKCLCIDAQETGDFKSNALETCYPLVPTHMKPMVLLLLQSVMSNADDQKVCKILVQQASDNVNKAMDMFFETSFAATQEMASSVDYLLQ